MDDTVNTYMDGVLMYCHCVSQSERSMLSLNRTKTMPHTWTKEDLDMIDKHYGYDMNSREIADELHIINPYVVNLKYWQLVKKGKIEKRELPVGGANARYGRMRRLV